MRIVICMDSPDELAGQYLETFDHDADNGFGYGTFTHDINAAMKFPDAGAALDFWKKQSTVRPLRPDGKPNRPLSASTIELEKIP